MANKDPIKVMIVGNVGIGRNHLLYRLNEECSYYDLIQEQEYLYWCHDDVSRSVIYNGLSYDITIRNIIEPEEFSRLKVLSMIGREVTLLCFSVMNEISLDCLLDYHYPTIEHHLGPNVKSILVGMKSDLRSNPNGRKSYSEEKLIQDAKIQRAKESLKVRDYIEISTLEDVNIDKLLELIVKCGLECRELKEKEKREEEKRKSKKCSLL